MAARSTTAPRIVAADPVHALSWAQPGLQFRSRNFLDGKTLGKSGRLYRQGDAFVLEPQLFPDTPNQPAFNPALARLAPGETYINRMVYRFGVDTDGEARD